MDVRIHSVTLLDMDNQASPTSCTRCAISHGSGTGGFTLVELIVSAALAGVILAGVLTSFIMLGKMGANIQNYSELEAKGRSVLEQFSREARMAYHIDDGVTTSTSFTTATKPISVKFYIPDTSSNREGTGTRDYEVIYAFKADPSDGTKTIFTRTGPPINDPTGSVAETTLMFNVSKLSSTTDYFRFFKHLTASSSYYASIAVSPANDQQAASYRDTKQIEVNFVAQKTSRTVTTASNKVLSARFILRNK